MKKLFFFLMIALPTHLISPTAVTYKKVVGRFGNCVYAFSQALWLSYKNNISMVYTPFTHGDKLHVSHLHAHIDDKEIRRKKRKSLRHAKKGKLNIAKNKNSLFVLRWKNSIKVDWDDEEFMKILRQEISLIDPLPTLELPKDRLSVALHIRAGSSKFDHIRDTWIIRHKSDQRYPHKFSPRSFYVEQLKRLSELLDDQPMYVHIFTDHKETERVISILKDEVNKPNIVYGYKETDNVDSDGVLGDFFDMVQFEYFIRSDSTYSYMASKLANWKIVISPKKSIWKNKNVKVVSVTTDIRAT